MLELIAKDALLKSKGLVKGITTMLTRTLRKRIALLMTKRRKMRGKMRIIDSKAL